MEICSRAIETRWSFVMCHDEHKWVVVVVVVFVKGNHHYGAIKNRIILSLMPSNGLVMNPSMMSLPL